jgi:hypothetical protein
MTMTSADPVAASADRLRLVREASGRVLRAVNAYDRSPEARRTQPMRDELQRMWRYTEHLFDEFKTAFEGSDATEALTALQKAEAGYELIFGAKSQTGAA